MNKIARKKEVDFALARGLMPSPLSAQEVHAVQSSFFVRLTEKMPILSCLIFICSIAAISFGAIGLAFVPLWSGYAIKCGLSLALGVIIFYKLVKVINYENVGLAPLEKNYCGEMLDALSEIENGADFRKQVLSQGRQFTKQEYYQALELGDSVSNRKRAAEQEQNCRALYGVGKFERRGSRH